MSRHDMIKGIIPPIITPMNEDESSATRSSVRSRVVFMVFSAMVQMVSVMH